MRILSAFMFLPALARLSGAVRNSNTCELTVQADYDAIIVGGGPAGLSAASGLARVRRNVLLIDSGDYRNALTRHMHDVIGFDGRWSLWKHINVMHICIEYTCTFRASQLTHQQESHRHIFDG